MPESYWANDYAGIRTTTADFYYGYEVTHGEEGEWCFRALITDQESITIPYSKLGTTENQFDCLPCLLAGMAIVLDRFKLVPKDSKR